MIDTVPTTKRLTNRSTAGEGHVVRHGDVRRVRKVIVGCPASRTLRGQPPAQTSSRYMRWTETVRNRLTKNKQPSLCHQKRQRRKPKIPKQKGPDNTPRAYKRVYPLSPISKQSAAGASPSPAVPSPLSRLAGEGQGEGDRGGQTGRAPQTTTTHHSNHSQSRQSWFPQRNPAQSPQQPQPSFQSFRIMAIIVPKKTLTRHTYSHIFGII